MVAATDEVLAAQFAHLAEDLDRQGQAWIAAMLRRASHHHRAASIQGHTLAAELDT